MPKTYLLLHSLNLSIWVLKILIQRETLHFLKKVKQICSTELEYHIFSLYMQLDLGSISEKNTTKGMMIGFQWMESLESGL